MKLGLFLMTGHRPSQSQAPGGYKKGFEWDLEMIKTADRLGFSEAWVGEHFTNLWEPLPSPDLLIQAALRETKQIVLAAGAHVPGFHHPAELAARISYQDQLFEGRYMVGIGSGGTPTDAQMFGIDMSTGEHRRKAAEGLEIMRKYWTEEGPWRFEGEFWTCEKVDADAFAAVPGTLGNHLKPYQQPHPPIAVAGLSANSATLKWAGEEGLLPISLGMNTRFMAGQWDTYSAAAESRGRTADRNNWRIAREVVVADTDEEALDMARNGYFGEFLNEFLLPIFKFLGYSENWKHDDAVNAADIDLEYLLRQQFLIGSVETVTEQLLRMQEETGGFGTLLMEGVDYEEDKDRWFRSMQLLAEEVVPAVNAELAKKASPVGAVA
ncbi:Flavin-dependent oxidoreductase, luciferase family (includes alkanesulfonate monooxygenase SsuD and methylene tetrahydromethanopterin reductase) [Arthrobacter sp. cf158]|uniref:LLM class flavin-dependent oxidoreductase n=1 Tax=Arthrobacter sp. cf158 TaxID=1761744 RepID=UPI0008968913|nr:LLM class flavin-dependent oxidoreductase [Arthrobacter sp. cf158]SDW86607.1 Flavin-dependent oxidoreductase, luciferase family (includes alkanesulfonate monooxygenase SsuD and methylene tetrahydromethanopterin reductase) [Arthrobacter sp. cf158]